MSGRNKQPLSVILGKGKSKHLTKAVIEERAAHEEKMRGGTNRIEAPSHLLKKQKEEFDLIASELLELDIMSNLDVDTLARYIEAKAEHVRLGPVIRNLNPVEDMDAYTKLSRARKMYSDECRSYANDLGLTITSRLKLVIPKKEEEKISDFDKKFGDV